jgi:FtsH-binding integral membrane protein
MFGYGGSMDSFFPTIFSKTFFILGTQFLVTFFSTKLLINLIRKLYEKKHPLVSATTNKDGELDLQLSLKDLKGYFFALLVMNIIVFLILLFWAKYNLFTALPVFTVWSILTGILVGLALISVDENLGSRVLNLTAMITFIAALVGIYSGIDFSVLGGILFFALGGLILFNLIRIFVGMKRNTQRIGAFFGVIIFVGYLLYDFNKLEKAKNLGVNSWPVAIDFAIDIYLDVINLFLQLLDLLSE